MKHFFDELFSRVYTILGLNTIVLSGAYLTNIKDILSIILILLSIYVTLRAAVKKDKK